MADIVVAVIVLPLLAAFLIFWYFRSKKPKTNNEDKTEFANILALIYTKIHYTMDELDVCSVDDSETCYRRIQRDLESLIQTNKKLSLDSKQDLIKQLRMLIDARLGSVSARDDLYLK